MLHRASMPGGRFSPHTGIDGLSSEKPCGQGQGARMKALPFVMGALFFTGFVFEAGAEFRFPMPEFESGYHHPEMNIPAPSRTPALVDLSLLAATLSFTAWAVLKRRSRNLVLMTAVFSLLYFGFYRKGCVCSVGSIQNMLGVFLEGSPGVPYVVAGFFFLPLLFALYFGRVFCAGVCPLGAIQEVVAVRPVQLSRPVEAALGLFAYAYLGLTVLSVFMGAGFLICRYDPFVGFFRQGASFNMFTAGGILLVAGIFIARPYCRFLCPYGVLLRWTSLFSKWHASITPDTCIQCRLCESSCPYGAIVPPVPTDRPAAIRQGSRPLGRLLLATPLIVLFSAWVGFMSHEMLAHLHPTVRLAEQVAAEEQRPDLTRTVETDAFRTGRQSVTELYSEAARISDRFQYASACFGAFMGLVLCGKLIRLSVLRHSNDYVPDRGACLSCARCFAYCPIEKDHVNH